MGRGAGMNSRRGGWGGGVQELGGQDEGYAVGRRRGRKGGEGERKVRWTVEEESWEEGYGRGR